MILNIATNMARLGKSIFFKKTKQPSWFCEKKLDVVKQKLKQKEFVWALKVGSSWKPQLNIFFHWNRFTMLLKSWITQMREKVKKEVRLKKSFQDFDSTSDPNNFDARTKSGRKQQLEQCHLIIKQKVDKGKLLKVQGNCYSWKL